MSTTVHQTQRLSRACLDTLSAWSAPDGEQDALRRLFLGHLGRHQHGWARQCRGAHLTASAVVCAEAERRVLLTLHARIGRWLQTGGHLEEGDSTLGAAALREATEESGIAGLVLDPTPLLLSRHLLSCAGEPTFHLDVQFLVTVPHLCAPTVSEESSDVQWFSPGGLPEVDASVLDLVRAAGARLDWS